MEQVLKEKVQKLEGKWVTVKVQNHKLEREWAEAKDEEWVVVKVGVEIIKILKGNL